MNDNQNSDTHNSGNTNGIQTATANVRIVGSKYGAMYLYTTFCRCGEPVPFVFGPMDYLIRQSIGDSWRAWYRCAACEHAMILWCRTNQGKFFTMDLEKCPHCGEASIQDTKQPITYHSRYGTEGRGGEWVLDTLAPCGAEQLPPALSFPAARCKGLAPDAEKWAIETKLIEEELARKSDESRNTPCSIF